MRRSALTPIFDPGIRKGYVQVGHQIGAPEIRADITASTVTRPVSVIAPTVTTSPGPPITFTLVGTPYTAINIPYYGDFDLTTQHLIVGDVGNATAYIFNCATNNPALLGSVTPGGGYYTARWGVTNATAFYFTYIPGIPSFQGIIPLNTSSHSAPTAGTRVLVPLNSDFFRHGSRLLISNFSDGLHRATISGGIPTLTGSALASAAGFGWGHPNDADTVFICRGASLLSLDISGASPTIRQTFAPGGGFNAGRCAAVGDTLYVVGNDTFHMVDITNPNSLSVLGSLSDVNFDGSGAITVEPNGLYAYVSNGTSGAIKRLDAVDCRNPASITVSGSATYPAGLANPTDMFYDSTGGDRLVVISQEPKIQIVAITR